MSLALTTEEKQHWVDAGYLHLRGVLTASEVATLRACVDAYEAYLRENPDAQAGARGEAGNQEDLCVLQAISSIPELDVLIDHPHTFGKVLGLMGPYIQVAGSELIVRYPTRRLATAAHPFHTDGGPSLARIFPGQESLVLTLKVQLFLSDVVEPSSGNMLVVPGSHSRPFPDTIEAFERIGASALEVHAAAGDAVIFAWSLWHGAAPNHSKQPRISVVLRYAQLWARPTDYEHLDQSVLARMTPRRRRLFGDLGENAHPGDYYRPPSREHLAIILGQEWLDAEQSRRYVEWESLSKALYSTELGGAGATESAY